MEDLGILVGLGLGLAWATRRTFRVCRHIFNDPTSLDFILSVSRGFVSRLFLFLDFENVETCIIYEF